MPISPRRLPPLRLAALVLLLSPAAAAQLPDAAPEAPSLLALPGELVGVRYAPGSLDRAVRLQGPFEFMAKDLRSWTKRRPPLAVYLLERRDWERIGVGLPYGLPARLAPAIVAQSAWGDAETVALWRDLLGAELPQPPGDPLRGSPGEAASLLPGDFLGLVEGARALLEASLATSDALWVSELLAHAVAVRTVWRTDPGRLELADRFYGLCIRQGGARRPLTEYSAGLTMESWLWFQGVFHEGARRLIEGSGQKVVKAMVQRAAKRGPLSAAELLGRHEAVAEWHRKRFVAAAPPAP